jgi:hypothetical protein
MPHLDLDAQSYTRACRIQAPLRPSRPIVYKLAALFSLDAFAGDFAIQSLMALWPVVALEHLSAGPTIEDVAAG